VKSELNSQIVFDDDGLAATLQAGRVVFIPERIHARHRLLEILARGLDFPDYFGWNWDALEECLCDLSWIGDVRPVVLLHADIPFAQDADARGIYLDILKQSVACFASTGQPPGLVAVFPVNCRREIEDQSQASDSEKDSLTVEPEHE